MTSVTTPTALLTVAANDDGVTAEKLVRAALVVARGLSDQGMVDWCTAELEGYDDVEIPEYRIVPVVLTATDRLGRHIPAVWNQPDPPRGLLDCSVHQPLGEVQRLAGTGASGKIMVRFPPEGAEKLRELFVGSVDVFQVIHRESMAAILIAVRQRVFTWAAGKLDAAVPLPGGLRLEEMLGLQLTDTMRNAVPPIQAVGSGVHVNISQLTGSSVIVNSPNATASVQYTSGIDTAAMKDLVAVLSDGLSRLAVAGHSPAALAPVQVLVDELRELTEMPQPRAPWIRQTIGSLKNVLEQAAGGVLGELAKPHVLALIAQVTQSIGT